MISVVAVDLDGTLLASDGTVSRRTLAALGACTDAGITVLPVTARAPEEVARIPGESGLLGTAICSLGAVFCTMPGGSVQQRWPFLGGVAWELVTRLRRLLPGLAFGWVGPGGVAREGRYPLRRPAHQTVERADRAQLDQAWHVYARDTRIRVLPSRQIRAAIGGLAQVHFGDSRRVVDFTAPGVDKGTGLRRWCEESGIPASRVAAIGDTRADLPMLRWAGVGATLANANPLVRRAVTRVWPDNDSDGAAAFLEHLAQAVDSGKGPVRPAQVRPAPPAGGPGRAG